MLDNNVLQSMSVFYQRFWPKSMDDCISQYDQKIEDLYIAFKGFYLESETLELVLEQWHDLQSRILGNAGLLNRRYHDLWPHMLIHFHKEYPLPLCLVVISLLVICDTSECERIFSLMNGVTRLARQSYPPKSDAVASHGAGGGGGRDAGQRASSVQRRSGDGDCGRVSQDGDGAERAPSPPALPCAKV